MNRDKSKYNENVDGKIECTSKCKKNRVGKKNRRWKIKDEEIQLIGEKAK